MSKAPRGAIEDYEGDGDWFKIGTSGASDGMHWDSDGQPEVSFNPVFVSNAISFKSCQNINSLKMNFTIPKTTPPGKYLIRVEHFNISPQFKQTQMFVNCAQVEVTGSGQGRFGIITALPKEDDL